MTKGSHGYSAEANNPPQRQLASGLSGAPGTSRGLRDRPGGFDQIGDRGRGLGPPRQGYRTVRDVRNGDRKPHQGGRSSGLLPRR